MSPDIGLDRTHRVSQVLIALGAKLDMANREGKKPVDIALDNATKKLLKKE